jgi:hypothetical protein
MIISCQAVKSNVPDDNVSSQHDITVITINEQNSLRSILHTVYGYDDNEKTEKIIDFVNRNIPNEGTAFYYEGYWEINSVNYVYTISGKYLIVNYMYYSSEGGSDYEDTMETYIFDIELLKIVTKKDIFNKNISNPSFRKLITEYLKDSNRDFEYFDQALLLKSLDALDFELFFSTGNVGIRWNQGKIVADGPMFAFEAVFEIIVPYSKMADYLTPIGKEIFGGKK